MKFLKREDAVSPVIGVILMVAITVILAAVIAAFVFGMAGSVSKTKTVAATAKQQGNDYLVTWQGGQDNSYAVGYNVTIDCNDPSQSAGLCRSVPRSSGRDPETSTSPLSGTPPGSAVQAQVMTTWLS